MAMCHGLSRHWLWTDVNRAFNEALFIVFYEGKRGSRRPAVRPDFKHSSGFDGPFLGDQN
jgi:hypothetical protein